MEDRRLCLGLAFCHLEATGNIPRFLYFLLLRLFSTHRCLHRVFSYPAPENPHKSPASHDMVPVFHNKSEVPYFPPANAGRPVFQKWGQHAPRLDFPDRFPSHLRNFSKAAHSRLAQRHQLQVQFPGFHLAKAFLRYAEHHFHCCPFLHKSHFSPYRTHCPDKFPAENRLCVFIITRGKLL